MPRSRGRRDDPGTRSRDVICGLGDNDTIRAGAGNVAVRDGSETGRIPGGPGSDRLFGEGNADGPNTPDGVRAKDRPMAAPAEIPAPRTPGTERACP